MFLIAFDAFRDLFLGRLTRVLIVKTVAVGYEVLSIDMVCQTPATVERTLQHAKHKQTQPLCLGNTVCTLVHWKWKMGRTKIGKPNVNLYPQSQLSEITDNNEECTGFRHCNGLGRDIYEPLNCGYNHAQIYGFPGKNGERMFLGLGRLYVSWAGVMFLFNLII